MSTDLAINFLYKKVNKKAFLAHFVPNHIVSPEEDPILICMAGSSGAGKTETAESMIIGNFGENNIIRIDADDVKLWLVDKLGGTVNDYHAASSLGVDIIYSECLKKKKNCIIDGTFVDQSKGIDNIERASKGGYSIFIIYVYQDPQLAWHFVKERKKKTGRNVPFGVFKDTFYKSIENVLETKKWFGNDVIVQSIRKNFDFSIEEYKLNVDVTLLQKLLERVKTIDCNKLK